MGHLKTDATDSRSAENALPRPVKGGAHKRVRHRKPAGGKRRPRVIEATRNELVRALETQSGSLWLRVRLAVSIAGYPIGRALHRVRSLRADGAESLLAMVVAMIYLANVQTGFIGKPRPGGGPHHRYTLADLAQLAYGAQATADLRRARRALDMMISLGWAFPTKQVRRYKGDDTFRSEPGVRWLNWTRLAAMAGTTWHLKRDRQYLDSTRGTPTASLQDARKRRQGQQNAISGSQTDSMRPDRPQATGDPPARTGGAQQIADILELFK